MKTHEFDATSLISGIVFAVVAGVYLAGAATGTHVDVRWLLPLTLIGLGIAGVAGAVTSAARQQRSTGAPEIDPGAVALPEGDPVGEAIDDA